MPWLGAHLSIAGGLHNAAVAAQDLGMDAVQLFSKNNNQWNAKDLKEDQITQFRESVRAAKLRYTIVHDCYLINLASPDDALYRRSIEAFVVEMQRAEQLGIDYLVMHPGAYVGSDEASGLRRVIKAFDEVHRRCRDFKLQVLVETTAGQGTSLGHRFEHLATILDAVKQTERLGVCLDTCHVFAAGYELAPRKQYLATLREFDRLVGLKRIRAFHLNDSRKPLGSRVDRHDHIGRGCLGLEPFRLLLNDRRFRARPMILETPKEEDGNDNMDAINLAALRALLQK